MGTALSGKLSCSGTGFVCVPVTSVFAAEFHLIAVRFESLVSLAFG